MLGAVVLTAQQLLPEARPSRVTFQHRCAADPEVYRQFFGCPVTFAASTDSVHAGNDMLSPERLPTSSPQVAQANTALCEEYLSSRHQGQVATRVREQLARLLRQGGPLSLGDVAAALAMSERKLQRLLREEGVQFRDLLDDVRAREAQQLLADNSLPVGRVAERLGFDSMSAFSRAFRRWYGTSPRDMRQASREGSPR